MPIGYVPSQFQTRQGTIPLSLLDADLAYVSTKVVNVEDFRAEGVTDEGTIRAAGVALQAAGGGTLNFAPSRTYNVWASSSSDLIVLTSVKNVVIRGNGSTIISLQTNGPLSWVVNANAVAGLWVENLNFIGSNTTLTPSTGEGMVAFVNGCSNVVGMNLTAQACFAMFQAGSYGFTGSPSFETVNYGFVALNCTATKVYYPNKLWMVNGGTIRMRTYNAGRSFFCINSKNFDVWLESNPGGPFSDCLIKVYTDPAFTQERNTVSNITLNYKSTGRFAGSGNQSSGEGCVDISVECAQPTPAPGVISNIRINYSVDCSSADKWANLLTMRRFNQGVPDPSVRNHIINGIVVTGVATNCANIQENG